MPETPLPREEGEAGRLARLETRLARIEAHLGLDREADAVATAVQSPPAVESAPEVSPIGSPVVTAKSADELEVQVGQAWFARVGILVFVLGVGFMLTLPFASVPAYLPPLGGLAVAGVLFAVAHWWNRSFELVASQLRGAAMALLYLAVLRLFFFSPRPALGISSPLAPVLLGLAVAVNVGIALHRNSVWLTALALITGCATALALGSFWGALGSLSVVVAVAALTSVRRHWSGLWVAAIGLTFATYALWAIGNPLAGGAFRYVSGPIFAPAFPLLFALIYGALPLFQPAEKAETPTVIGGALANCGLGYGVFLVHSAASYPKIFPLAHIGASVLFLGLAIVFWRQRESRVSTFFYAMTGYAALSFAIIKLAAVPEVFVWLSLQSVLVVVTAIWFRSRAIVVANFLIFVGIVLTYMAVKGSETGISLGFGIVALVSARILNWQKHRLELKTELMRNAYLVSAYIVFPYALYHLVPGKFVGLAWTGMAIVYYVLNFLVRSQKYRWMGHATLLLTAAYLIAAGGRHLEPAWRVTSLLILGVVLLVVSLVFTRLQRRGP